MLRKLSLLKVERGGLSQADERQFIQLRRCRQMLLLLLLLLPPNLCAPLSHALPACFFKGAVTLTVVVRRKLESEVLAHADVVCATCAGAGDPRVQALRFQHVLIDEATQAAEPEALIPLVLGAKQVTGVWRSTETDA